MSVSVKRKLGEKKVLYLTYINELSCSFLYVFISFLNICYFSLSSSDRLLGEERRLQSPVLIGSRS